MRAERVAAIANFLLVLLVALGLTTVSELSSRGDAVVYAHPYQYAVRTAATVMDCWGWQWDSFWDSFCGSQRIWCCSFIAAPLPNSLILIPEPALGPWA